MAAPGASQRSPIITLTTDFGTRDAYVPSLKGVILSLNPAARIVDISHEISPQAVVEGGFVLACAFQTFPAGTIHVLVVDPGVGTSRRLLVARTENHVFLAPDNGVLGQVFEQEPAREVFSITSSHYFLRGAGATFDGRDILAPVAAWISRGTALSHFGEPVTSWIPSPLPPPKVLPDGRLQLRILHVDRFGNVILNLKEHFLDEHPKPPGKPAFAVELGTHRITRMQKTYGEATPQEPFALFNSSGYLEVALRNGPAASVLKVAPGEPAVLSFVESPPSAP